MEWFRMYSEARNDAKLRSLNDSQFRVWFNLLCFSNEQPERGTISDIDEELLAVEVANGDTELLRDVLARLEKLRIIERDDITINFINFKKRNYDKPSDLPERVKERVTRHREKQRNTNVTPCNASETQCNPLYTDTEAEADIDPETDTETDPLEAAERGECEGGETSSAAPELTKTEREALAELKSIPGYPFDFDKDLKLIRNLETDFPDVEMVPELKKYHIYKLDHPLKKNSNPRLQIRNWFENASKWRKRGVSGAGIARADPRDDGSAKYDEPVPGFWSDG